MSAMQRCKNWRRVQAGRAEGTGVRWLPTWVKVGICVPLRSFVFIAVELPKLLDTCRD